MNPSRLKSEAGKQNKVFLLFLIGTCAVLAVVCACLIAALVLLRSHFDDKNDQFSVGSSLSNGSSSYSLDQSIDGEVMLGDQSDSEMVTVRKVDNLPEWETDFRLPKDVLPLRYDLLLHPELENGTFTGDVTIEIRITNSRSFVAVNTKNLDIYETRLKRENDTDIPISAFEYKRNEFWIVKGNNDFVPGLYYLHMKFRGTLVGKQVGFYRSVYNDRKTNTKRTIATSKFQPTYARQAFPCFDEPSFKPTFKIQLVRPTSEYNALSNMNVVSEQPDTPSTGLTTVTFATSVKMVTYLACFIVSDFTSLPEITVTNPDGPFPFRVYATPAQTKSGKTQFALDTGVNIVSYYIEYFDIAYPLPKLDMIAIPDFVSGAMEHWGLITFREANLLYSKDVSSSANQQRVATVIAHELAHMWFGNLMTLKWWDDLWLNEGFASYMEYKGTDHAQPSWNMMDQFLIDDLHPVLKLDAALSSHPIVQTVGHPDQITELFDTISYNKGAAVIRMLEDFLTVEKFQLGIHNFLTKFKFSNAVTQDLWDALQDVAEPGMLDVTVIMDTWTRQMGFPVVTVTKVGNEVTLTQERFLADPEADTTGDVSPYGYKWEIPITFVTNNAPAAVQAGDRLWMHKTGEPLTFTLANVDWFKFNFHQIGYYRVNYPVEQWQSLASVMTSNLETLTVADRGHLLDDAFSLADASRLNYDVALDMSKYLDKETEYVPWTVASNKLLALHSILADSLAFPHLREYIKNIVNTRYEDVTWTVPEGDGHLRSRLRLRILELACQAGHEKCLTEVGKLFTDWIDKPEVRPSPDLRSLIYYNGLASAGSEANWDKMWNLYLTEEDAQEKIKLMYGLAAVKEPWLLRRYVEYAKNESYVRSQDYFTVLTYISGNPIGTPIVWDFVRAEWEYLVDRFTLNDRYLGRLIPSITQSFTTKFKLQEMEAFFALYPDAGAGTTARAQALEVVSDRIKWLERNEMTVKEWLEREVSKY